MERSLLITSTDLMMVQFLIPHVRNLSERGWAVTLACSDVGGRMEEIREKLPGVPLYPIRLRRSPFGPENLLGYWDLRKLLKSGSFSVIWTNEPVMGAMTRLAARGTRAKLMYLCHGFHFYRGGNPINWAFYPVERLLSRFTDLLVTVNREDLALAKTMKARRTGYLTGIGVDPGRLVPQGDLRRELGLGPGDRLVLCVGELNRNKDQAALLRAAARLKDPKLHVALCGKGSREARLRKLARRLGIGETVHFLGYRRDMGTVYAGTDLLVHPSRREGLGLAVLEGALSGLPVIAWDIRGIRDYGEHLLRPGDVAGLAEALRHPPKPIVRKKLAPYLLETSKIEIERLLESL